MSHSFMELTVDERQVVVDRYGFVALYLRFPILGGSLNLSELQEIRRTG